MRRDLPPRHRRSHNDCLCPIATLPRGGHPCGRRHRPLQVAALASDIGLPCGLALAAAGHSLVGGLGYGLAVGGRPCMGAGRPSSSLPSLRKRSKNA
ncbi:hypothetical protein GW17_00038876 [Ensete ventricosum]|nr:hypothetical protein GW17_00038876 [Ensete ventricosum]